MCDAIVSTRTIRSSTAQRMLTDKVAIDDLPPVVQLLLRELTHDGDRSDFHKRIRKLLPEVRRQAEWTVKNSESVYRRSNTDLAGLFINPASGLDPFSFYGKCVDLDCRVQNADHIARIVGLYADTATIGDPFTDFALVERWTQDDTIRLMGHLVVFARLLPLFTAGVFRFQSNFGAFCQAHHQHFLSLVDEASKAAFAELSAGIRVEQAEDMLVVHTDALFGRPMSHRIYLNSRLKRQMQRSSDLQKFGLELFEHTVRGEIHETIFRMTRNGRDAITLSDSRVAFIAARHFDGGVPSTREIEIWEAKRSANLPWVTHLSAEDIVALRDAASNALPRFRLRMARAMTSATSADAGKIVNDLREEAAEVEAELRALDKRGERRFRTLSGLLGMTISVYGFAGEFLGAGAALTGLASLLGLLHAADHKERQDAGKLTSRPGYVLVKAKELAQHASQRLGT